MAHQHHHHHHAHRATWRPLAGVHHPGSAPDVVWHEIVLQDWHEATASTTEASVSNLTSTTILQFFNQTYIEPANNTRIDNAVELVRMIATAIVLLLVILATVIGKHR